MDSKEDGDGEKVNVCVIYGKEKYTVETTLDEPVAEFKRRIEKLTGVPSSVQKLIVKGTLSDGATLRECKVGNGCKVMLIGSKPADVMAVNIRPNPFLLKQEERKRTQHMKILEKGIPQDAMPGIKNAKDPLPTFSITGMVNKIGGKVRLTFKLELDQVWIETAEKTEKLQMSQIHNVLYEPIEGHEEYHIMAFQLGPTEQSLYFFYWVPSQYVDAIKRTVIGAF